MRSSSTGFLQIFLLVAVSVCVVCTLIVYYGCSCDLESPQIHKTAQALQSHGELPSKTKPSTYLLIVIMSSPNDTMVRNTIRNTWLKLTAKPRHVVDHTFPVGVKGLSQSELDTLNSEQKEFGDLALLTTLEESYSGLARKTLSSIQFAHENFDAQYLLKVDSDSFVRIGSLLSSLLDFRHERLYWGFLDGRAKPIRKGKWRESDWILCDRYLPYQLGGGYVISKQLVQYLATNAHLLKMYKNEDVSVGAWLAGLDVKYVHDPRFDTEWVSRGCSNRYIITHKKSPKELEQLYNNIKGTGALCEREFRARMSYANPHEAHAKFVSNTTGGPQSEIFIIQLIGLASCLVRNLLVPWLFLGRPFNTSNRLLCLKFALDFAILCVPLLLGFTILSSHLHWILLALTVLIVLISTFIVFETWGCTERLPMRHALHMILDDAHQPTMFLNYSRFFLMLTVVIAILAVDVPIFPRRFAKTETTGHSLMDTGVSHFVAALAVGTFYSRHFHQIAGHQPKAHRRTPWYLQSFVVLPVIGLLRTVSLALLDYPQHITEYGIHWNFFFTFAILKLANKIIPRNHPLIVALILGVAHHMLLTKCQFQDWILFGENKRENLITANIEGLVSLVGYLCIYYGAMFVAKDSAPQGMRIRYYISSGVSFFFYAGFFLLCQLFSEHFIGAPSRRLYLSSITVGIFVIAQSITLFAWISRIPNFTGDGPWDSVSPCLAVSINDAGLWVFLLSNLMTGLANFLFNTHSMDTFSAFALVFSYLFILHAIFFFAPKIYEAYKKHPKRR
ncbi:hypothetical protein WR25_02256 [Diploscapter pachys]|uniref:galactosylxylosylprotein 3-beta-galactosyltransferase n=1 Tax=Diploscapter pachys TaxID=2018661 RepID=A0A2A2LF63_9BILA|nr:hypothetical protein WR25_02256 [Diploscapter pachys]